MERYMRSISGSRANNSERNTIRSKALGSQRTKLTGEEIRFLRETMEIDRKNFADILDISKHYLTRLEDGTEEPSSLLDIHIRAVYGFAQHG